MEGLDMDGPSKSANMRKKIMKLIIMIRRKNYI